MLQRITMRKKRNKGFTVVEVLIAVLILLPVFVSVMYVFIRSMELSDMARHSSEAVREVRSRITDIENTPFAQVDVNYNNSTFTIAGIDGIGVTYVDDSVPNILEITNSFCWQESNGRLIGEDTNLNGVLDAGEDDNGNGIIDSPVMIVTKMFDT